MKRSLKGSAVTKYLCNMSVTGLCGLIKSSGRHDDGRCQMGGETSANLPAAWPGWMKPRGSEQERSSAYKTHWSVSDWVSQMLWNKSCQTSDPPDALSFLNRSLCSTDATILLPLQCEQGKHTAIWTTTASFSAKTGKVAADLKKKILYP